MVEKRDDGDSYDQWTFVKENLSWWGWEWYCLSTGAKELKVLWCSGDCGLILIYHDGLARQPGSLDGTGTLVVCSLDGDQGDISSSSPANQSTVTGCSNTETMPLHCTARKQWAGSYSLCWQAPKVNSGVEFTLHFPRDGLWLCYCCCTERCISCSRDTASPLHSWYQIFTEITSIWNSYLWRMRSTLLFFVKLEGTRAFPLPGRTGMQSPGDVCQCPREKVYVWIVHVFKFCFFWEGFTYLISTIHLSRIATVREISSKGRGSDLEEVKKTSFQIKYHLDRSLIATDHNLEAPCYLWLPIRQPCTQRL